MTEDLMEHKEDREHLLLELLKNLHLPRDEYDDLYDDQIAKEALGG